MRRRLGLAPLALLLLTVAACGKKQEPAVVPTPESAPDRNTPTPTPTRPPVPDAGPDAAAVTRAVAADLANVIHFDFDQSLIKPEDRPVLDRKAAILQANPSLRIRVSGHADDRGSDEYNLVLGNKRALAAKQYLIAKGIDAGRIDVTSYGEERPVDTAATEAAWAANRRDEFEIIAGGDRLVQPR